MIEDPLNMKAKVEDVLKSTNNMENRAAKMDVDDLLAYVTSCRVCVLNLIDHIGCYLLFMMLEYILHDGSLRLIPFAFFTSLYSIVVTLYTHALYYSLSLRSNGPTDPLHTV
jgi:nitroimidazol reductase NimA-like FMN-containing flavoprotein (pyridoxamine 5'-phosphate oxidase superfamily)